MLGFMDTWIINNDFTAISCCAYVGHGFHVTVSLLLTIFLWPLSLYPFFLFMRLLSSVDIFRHINRSRFMMVLKSNFSNLILFPPFADCVLFIRDYSFHLLIHGCESLDALQNQSSYQYLCKELSRRIRGEQKETPCSRTVSAKNCGPCWFLGRSSK